MTMTMSKEEINNRIIYLVNKIEENRKLADKILFEIEKDCKEILSLQKKITDEPDINY